MNKHIHTVAFFAISVLALVNLSFIAKNNKNTIYINTNEKSPIGLIGYGGERIYLRFGTIYALKDDPKKEYRVVAINVFHVTQKQLERMIFFNTPEEAEVAGYKPSENLARDYDCVKQGKDLFECPERNSMMLNI